MAAERVCLLPIEGSGGKDMVKADLWHEMHSRFKLKETKKVITRALGLDVRTARKLLRHEAPRVYERERRRSGLLAGFEERIRRRVAAVGYCAMSIYEELRADGYRGGYDVVRRFVGPQWEEATIEATMRFERLRDGKARPGFRRSKEGRPEVFYWAGTIIRI